MERSRRAAAFTRLAGTLGIVSGSLVLLAWAFDIRVLKQPLSTTASMKANTALAFILAGVALRRLSVDTQSRMTRGLGALVALLGLLTLGEDIFGLDLGIDQRLFTDQRSSAPSSPGRMSPITALCFLALGLALVASTSRRRPWLAQPPALVSALLAAIAAVGYLFDVRALHGIGPYATMAVHTAGLMLVLSLGLLVSQSDVGVMRPIMSDHVEGLIARRLIPAGIAIPIVLGWICLDGQRAGLYSTEFGLALVVVGTMVMFSVVTWLNARALGKADERRRQAQEAVRQMNANLENRIAERTATLSRSESLLRLVVDKAHDAFVAMDQEGRITEWNPQAEATFGWSRTEMIGRFVRDTIIPERYQCERGAYPVHGAPARESLSFRRSWSRRFSAVPALAHQRTREHVCGRTRASRCHDRSDDLRNRYRKAVPVGLLVNELITNALKHAFPDGRTGRVSVHLSTAAGAYLLLVTDDGVGLPEGIEHQKTGSVGLEIVTALSGQLRGKHEFRRDNGTQFRLEFPI
jgi:PAS domain-containing protein